jgi:hypothetical protein
MFGLKKMITKFLNQGATVIIATPQSITASPFVASMQQSTDISILILTS